ncbi:MAG: shikimate kinase [Cyanobacteriota bacterium]
MHNKKNIVLIGLMGAGKTSVGKFLAQEVNLTFVDIDEEIEKIEELSIAKIFELKGEQYFREIETNLINKFSRLDNQIISTGGGAPENPANIKNLSQNGILFYLFATIDTLFDRLSNEISNRPMLFAENPKEKLKYLLNRREPFYLKADHKIDTSNKSIQEISKAILKHFYGDEYGRY